MPISYPVMTKISMGTIHRLRRKTLTIMHILHSGYGLPVDGESLRRRLINWGLQVSELTVDSVQLTVMVSLRDNFEIF